MLVRVLIAPWFVIGILIGGGWWLVASLFLVLTVIAHRLKWSLLRYIGALLALAIGLPTFFILTGA